MALFVESRGSYALALAFLDHVQDKPPLPEVDLGVLEELVEKNIVKFQTFALVQSSVMGQP